MPNNPSQVQFQEVPMMNLNPDGSITDKSGWSLDNPSKPADIGIPTEQLHKEVIGLAEKKVPLDKVYRAIDQHSDIKDKQVAKGMAEAIYQIVGVKDKAI